MNELLSVQYSRAVARTADVGCRCAGYLIVRRPVLEPAIRDVADTTATDAGLVLSRLVRGVHARHLNGGSLAVAS